MRQTKGQRIFGVFNVIFMILLCIVIIYPILNLFAQSVSDDLYLLRGDVTFYPIGFSLDAYAKFFNSSYVMRAFINSVFVAGVGCLTSLTMTLLAAYPIAFGRFSGKKIYTVIVFFPMWFVAGMIPEYLVVQKMGLLNSFASLILIALVAPYHVIILSTFLKSIPISLHESARIDGANELTILIRIVLPLAKAAMATIALWVIVGHWNDYFKPLMYLTDFEKYTFQLALKDIVLSADAAGIYGIGGLEGYGLSLRLKSAMLIFSMLPMLILYPFLQQYFVKGVMIGSIKG
ncbi:MAG: carbohydrate ABC transporter permease [Clostridia bacterium]|nr:carbohydrate ABC transporter permease [Clostridia bacterium]